MPKKLNPIVLYRLYVRRVVGVLVACVAISTFSYAFFLLGAVSHAASQAEARREIAALSAEVGKLQSQYLSATKALTPQRARSMGFVSPVHVAVVYAEQGTLSLSLKTQ